MRIIWNPDAALVEKIRALTALYGRCPEREPLTEAPEADTIATEPVPGK